MCGIIGILNTSGKSCFSQQTLASMVVMLHHRGPDQKGIYCDNSVGLAHARLSIIDLKTGGQPIHNEDQTIWIVFNGEIYNYLELKKTLESKGHHFYTNSDTEVIIHNYEQKGVDCLEDFNGQFAFAIWDIKKQQLFLARDRVGICPLFYAEHNGVFIFGSEIKALLASNLLSSPSLDPIALDQIFTLWTTLPGKTVFKNIYELKAGHALVVNKESRFEHAYWDIPYNTPYAYLNESPEQLCEQIMALLMDATRLRLRADVPVGSYLSGGLDSSGITALIAHNFNSNIQTFGIRFQENDFDEGTYQNEMVNHLRVKHHELVASNNLIAETFPEVVWHCEKPLLRTAPVPMFLLSRFVKQQGITVVCTGEGADEVFGGYDIFREALVRKFIARQPNSRFRPMLLEQLYPQIFKNERAKISFRNFIMQNSSDTHNPLFSHLIRWTNTARTKQFFANSLQETIGSYSVIEDCLKILPESFNDRDTLSKAQYLEDTIFLSTYLLSSQGDRMAMANSIEMRPPYLDHRIFELMSRVSPRWKILGINEKHLLKKVFKDILPASITQRTKQPYRAPIQQTFKSHFQTGYIKDILSQQSVNDANLFDYAKIVHLIKKIESGISTSETEGMAITGLISSQLIYSQFVKSFPYKKNPDTKWDICFDKRTNS
jgi:asparagine synthase (glutamine-hydrolysing)